MAFIGVNFILQKIFPCEKMTNMRYARTYCEVAIQQILFWNIQINIYICLTSISFFVSVFEGSASFLSDYLGSKEFLVIVTMAVWKVSFWNNRKWCLRFASLFLQIFQSDYFHRWEILLLKVFLEMIMDSLALISLCSTWFEGNGTFPTQPSL